MTTNKATESIINVLQKEVFIPKTLQWKKFNEKAQIPTKRKTDVGYDVYMVENNVWLKPHETRLFSIGLGCLIPQNHWLQAADRGSTGSKGIHVHCGIIDEQYMGEIFICLNNTNNYPILFTDEVDKVCFKRTWYGRKYMCYPVSKGIAQLIVHRNRNTESKEVDDATWSAALEASERKEGKLGESGK